MRRTRAPTPRPPTYFNRWECRTRPTWDRGADPPARVSHDVQRRDHHGGALVTKIPPARRARSSGRCPSYEPGHLPGDEPDRPSNGRFPGTRERGPRLSGHEPGCTRRAVKGGPAGRLTGAWAMSATSTAVNQPQTAAPPTYSKRHPGPSSGGAVRGQHTVDGFNGTSSYLAMPETAWSTQDNESVQPVVQRRPAPTRCCSPSSVDSPGERRHLANGFHAEHLTSAKTGT